MKNIQIFRCFRTIFKVHISIYSIYLYKLQNLKIQIFITVFMFWNITIININIIDLYTLESIIINDKN